MSYFSLLSRYKKQWKTTERGEKVIEEVIALELYALARYEGFFFVFDKPDDGSFLDMKIMFRWKMCMLNLTACQRENPSRGHL